MERKGSEYYLGNHDSLPTVLTLKTDNSVINIELPWDATMEQLCQAFYTACIGITFHPDTVVRGMQEFVEENLPTDNE